MKRMIAIALILAAILCHSTALQANTPITYQGRLDAGGQPHTGTVGMVFELYDQESSGNPDWLVEIRDSAGNPVDRPFQIQVTC